MFDRLKNVVTRYDDLTQQMADPAVLGDMARLQQVAREQRELEAVVTAYQRYERLSQQLSEAQQLINDTDDADLRTMAQDEIAELTPVRTDLEAQLKLLLLPRDPNDERSVIMELRQGEGGDESALFAADLFRMYSRYAERVGWKVEVVNSSENGIGGFKEISFEIHGDGAYSRLKYEGGVHRVQRVPATEARGRIHTSTATVAVLPKLDEDGAVEIKQEDLRIDVFRSGGHGGQGVNTTDSAVRIVYKGGTPDEMVVTCQDGRSQLKNKEKAMTVLRARLFAIQEAKRSKALGESRLAQVGTGERSEKIRTYNFPQDRITDHRIGQSFSNLPGMLDGDIVRMIDALIVYDNAERLHAVGVDA
ncbi:MAG: peptide chain release factor 1 [Roseiflexaceae bacterium]|jgi:peptide chain release factor 1|nr:peptide chain release factor 1 [Chloroflexaceae bacterium]